MSERRAITSASNLHRRAGCPGSEAAERYQPEPPAGKAAEIGTLKHFYDANPEIEIEEVEHESSIARNRELRENFLAAQLPLYGMAVDAPRQEFKLIRYKLCDELGKPVIGPDGLPFSGEPDIAYFFPEIRLLIIFDSKFGRIRVTAAAKNLQLRSYAVMMADPDFGSVDANKVLAAITQPLVSPPVHAVEFDVKALREAKAEILEILRAARAPDAPRIASPGSCFGCRAAGCREGIAMTSLLAVERLKEVKPEQLEHLLLTVVPGVLNVADKIKERVEYLATNYPHLLKLMHMVDVPPSIVIEPENAVAAFEDLNIKYGERSELLTSEEFLRCCKPSRAKIEIAIAEKHGMTLDEAKHELAIRLGTNITARPRAKQLKKRK